MQHNMVINYFYLYESADKKVLSLAKKLHHITSFFAVANR